MNTSSTAARPSPAHEVLRAPLAALDRLLGRVSMYRLVTILLVLLAVRAFVAVAVGDLDPGIFTVGPMLLSLLILVAASAASGWALARAFGTRAHLESTLITALLLWFLYWPQQGIQLIWLAAAAVLANLSKYLFAWRGRHIFNPAAAGVVLLMLIQHLPGIDPAQRLMTTWWVASRPLLPLVVVTAFLVLRRTRHLSLGLVFVVVAAGLAITSSLSQDVTLQAALEGAFVSSPIIFFAGFMLSEPLTLPPRRNQQLLAAAVAGVVFTWPLWGPALAGAETTSIGFVESWLEPALLIANLIAFAFTRRGRIELRLRQRRELPDHTWAFDFEPRRPLRFTAGQFLELHLPHRRDSRGERRVFSIASRPGEDVVTVAMKVPTDRPSSFKAALQDLSDGDVVAATGVGGDFVLGRADDRLLLVAGGIGITPFLAQADELAERDAVLVYGLNTVEIPFRDELLRSGLPVIVVSPEPPHDLPSGWQHVVGARIDADLLRETVTDLGERRAFISGPPVMVDACRSALRGSVAGVRTDHFAGY